MEQLAIIENSKNFYKKQLSAWAANSSKINTASSTTRSLNSKAKYYHNHRVHNRQLSNQTPINLIYNQSVFHPVATSSNKNHRRSVQKHHKINGNTYNNTSGAVAGIGLGLGEFSLTNQNTNDTLANVRVNKSSTNRMEGDF